MKPKVRLKKNGQSWGVETLADGVTRLSSVAKKNIGPPSQFKSQADYRHALAAECAKLRKQSSNKELIERVAKSGRPTEYRKDFADIARIVCSLYGSTIAELARFFKVNEERIHGWIAEYPEFDKAVHDRSSEMNMQIMGRLARRALGFYANTEKIFYDVKRADVVRVPTKEYHPPSENAIFFWLKNRLPDLWKDRKELDTTENRNISIEIFKNFETMTPEQAADAYQELLKGEAPSGTQTPAGKARTITDVPFVEGGPPKSKT